MYKRVGKVCIALDCFCDTKKQYTSSPNGEINSRLAYVSGQQTRWLWLESQKIQGWVISF